MKKFILFLCVFISFQNCLALSGEQYMERFNNYLSFSQNLPTTTPSAPFLEFISGTAPLSTKLREKWLYELAKNKDWTHFSQYYQPSNDLNLVCYEQIANYNTGKQQEALKASIPLWLSGDSRPPSCNSLFDLLLQDNNFDQNLITQRIALALERRNIQLARYLLTKYKKPHPLELNALNTVYQNPENISKLNPGVLNDDIYLYGLKRMVSINMDKALKLWQQSKTPKCLVMHSNKLF